jgi:hypothetical protein
MCGAMFVIGRLESFDVAFGMPCWKVARCDIWNVIVIAMLGWGHAGIFIMRSKHNEIPNRRPTNYVESMLRRLIPSRPHLPDHNSLATLSPCRGSPLRTPMYAQINTSHGQQRMRMVPCRLNLNTNIVSVVHLVNGKHTNLNGKLDISIVLVGFDKVWHINCHNLNVYVCLLGIQ